MPTPVITTMRPVVALFTALVMGASFGSGVSAPMPWADDPSLAPAHHSHRGALPPAHPEWSVPWWEARRWCVAVFTQHKSAGVTVFGTLAHEPVRAFGGRAIELVLDCDEGKEGSRASRFLYDLKRCANGAGPKQRAHAKGVGALTAFSSAQYTCADSAPSPALPVSFPPLLGVGCWRPGSDTGRDARPRRAAVRQQANMTKHLVKAMLESRSAAATELASVATAGQAGAAWGAAATVADADPRLLFNGYAMSMASSHIWSRDRCIWVGGQ